MFFFLFLLLFQQKSKKKIGMLTSWLTHPRFILSFFLSRKNSLLIVFFRCCYGQMSKMCALVTIAKFEVN